jgi:hypothetical protein
MIMLRKQGKKYHKQRQSIAIAKTTWISEPFQALPLFCKAAFRFANSLALACRLITPVNAILTSEFLGKAFISVKS